VVEHPKRRSYNARGDLPDGDVVGQVRHDLRVRAHDAGERGARIGELPGHHLDQHVGDDRVSDLMRIDSCLHQKDIAVEKTPDPVAHDPVGHVSQTTRHLPGRHTRILLGKLDDLAVQIVQTGPGHLLQILFMGVAAPPAD
jgi:hypothetical protein